MNTEEQALATKEEKIAATIDGLYEPMAAIDPLVLDLYAKLVYSLSDGESSSYAGIDIPPTAKEGTDPKKGIILVADSKFGIQILHYKLYLWFKHIDPYIDTLNRRQVWLDMYDNGLSPAAVLEEYGYNNHHHLIIDDTNNTFWLNEESVDVMHQLLIQREQLYKEKGYKTYLFTCLAEFGTDPMLSAQLFIENEYRSDSYTRLMQISELMIWKAVIEQQTDELQQGEEQELPLS